MSMYHTLEVQTRVLLTVEAGVWGGALRKCRSPGAATPVFHEFLYLEGGRSI